MRLVRTLRCSAALRRGARSLRRPLAQTKWNLPAAYPADNPHTDEPDRVRQGRRPTATGGKLQITVHAGASLFKAPEIKRAVQTGQAQVGEVLISLHENEDPMFGIDVDAVPGDQLSAGEEAVAGVEAGDREEARVAGPDAAVRGAVGAAGHLRQEGHQLVDDMKGLKWRAYNVGTSRIAELVGAQPVTIQAAELPQALATGVVNAFMTSGSTGYDSKAWETHDALLRHAGLDPEERDLREQGGVRRARQADAGRDPEGGRRRRRRAAGSSRRKRPAGISTSSRPTR